LTTGLLDRALSGDQLALARLSTLIENDDWAVLDRLDELTPPPVHVLGITGPPGAGKSSLINVLLGQLVKQGNRVAVILVDPSSQTSGGAVLGDRIRMLSWGGDDVFVRSQATRGQEGGLAASTAALIDLYAVAGFGLIVIETVGVGQDGIDIRQVCDTTIVVQSPNQGDGIQAMKAGILEIADIFVVTKADLPGSQVTVRDLNAMVHLNPLEESGWSVPVVAVSATETTGIDKLADAIASHREWWLSQQGSECHTRRRSWEVSRRAIARLNHTSRGESTPSGASRRQAVDSLLKRALHSET
jgi:LAO/AO transport system kinase